MDMVQGVFRAFRARRLAREQYSFELLKSTSAQEFRDSYGSPRFASHHERLCYENTPNEEDSKRASVKGQRPDSQSLRSPKPIYGSLIDGGDSQTSPTCSSHLDHHRPSIKRSEETIDYSDCSASASEVSVLLGFIHSSCPCPPSCSGFSFTSDDATYEKAVSECHSIKESPLFNEGLLLKCIDQKPLFPYLHFAHFFSPDYNRRTKEVTQVIRDCGASPNSQYGCYDEVYTIQKAATMTENRLPSHRHAGYIAIGFKLLDDASKPQALEKSWLKWSGAREIYKYSQRNWNLRRISLLRHPSVHRNEQPRPFAYVLLCEYGSILHPSNTVQALDMCERMRVRNCGHVALYQVHTFYNVAPQVPIAGQSSSQQRIPKRNPMLRGFSQDVESTEARRQRLAPQRDRSFGYMEEEHFETFNHAQHQNQHYPSNSRDPSPNHRHSSHLYDD